MKHKLADKVVEMKDDRLLFARRMIVARTCPELYLKKAIGQHEFTVLSQALFAIEGTLLYLAHTRASSCQYLKTQPRQIQRESAGRKCNCS